jgi:hypothetical protein
MRIDPCDCEPGCILEHKAGGWKTVSGLLSRLLRICDRNYDKWGWHLSIAYTKGLNGWWILEATEDGVELNYYDNLFLFRDTRIYRWFETPPCRDKMDAFMVEHIGQPYDVAIYFWSGLAVIIQNIFHIKLPKITNRRWTCWELIQEFTQELNKPILSPKRIVIISDLILRLNRDSR